jgi:hypothetical protein
LGKPLWLVTQAGSVGLEIHGHPDVQRKAWELLAKTESEGDHRGAIVALREVRECLESLGEMLAKANTATGGTAETKIIVRFVGPGDEPERERP